MKNAFLIRGILPNMQQCQYPEHQENSESSETLATARPQPITNGVQPRTRRIVKTKLTIQQVAMVPVVPVVSKQARIRALLSVARNSMDDRDIIETL